MKKPSVILTADWHLRETKPKCRTDNFWITQWKKVSYIVSLAQYYKIPIIIAGDLYHKDQPSCYLLSTTIEKLNKGNYVVYGQHDLPDNQLKNAHKSGIRTLQWSGMIQVLGECHYDETPKDGSLRFPNSNRNVLVWHKFVWDGKTLPWPGCEEQTAEEVLDQYPQFDLIVTGDHHKPFTFKKDGRLLINPGLLTRQKADEKINPRVYLWYEQDNTVEEQLLEIEEDAVTDEYIRQEEARDNRMSAFVERLDGDWEVSVNFEQNVKEFVSNNKISKPVVDVVNKSIKDNYE